MLEMHKQFNLVLQTSFLPECIFSRSPIEAMVSSVFKQNAVHWPSICIFAPWILLW